MPRDELLGALHVSVGNYPDDLRHRVYRKIDPHDSARLRDMDVGRRMVEGVDSHLETRLANYRRHIIPNALGYFNRSLNPLGIRGADLETWVHVTRWPFPRL
jgi:hypothetical protein